MLEAVIFSHPSAENVFFMLIRMHYTAQYRWASFTYKCMFYQEGSVKKKHKLAKELSDLVNYFTSTSFEDFQISLQKRENKHLI